MNGNGPESCADVELEARAYHPERHCTMVGFVVMMMAMGLAGFSLGYLGGLARPLIPAAVALLTLVGILSGVIGILVGRRFRIRSPVSCALAGLVAGASAVYAVSTCSWGGAPGNWTQASVGVFPPGAAPGRPGTDGASRGAKAGQAAVVAAIVGVMVARSSRKPFCTRCGAWKKTRFMGSVDAGPDEAVEAFRSGRLHAIEALHPITGVRKINVFLTWCELCGQGAVCEVRVEQRVPGADRGRTLAELSYPGAAVSLLPRVFTGWIEQKPYATVASTHPGDDAPGATAGSRAPGPQGSPA